MLLLAAREQRTLSGVEERHFHGHLETCTTCQSLAAEDQVEWRWLTRIQPDALDDRELPVLPTVDPIVFDAATVLASGGMGKISRAYDRRLGREVAIKETLDSNLRARFEREVRITARLQHPAIVSIYEAGTFPDGSTFYTMRLVPGRTLHDAIHEATTLEQRLRLMPHLRAVTDALAYAHANGVIHRDLKPGNVLVGEFGETVVIDWGLAKELARGDHDRADTPVVNQPELTRVGAVIGTPSYMSPAQAAGAPADITDDVYALGAMLYQLLAGTAPYRDVIEADSDLVIAATVDGPPTPLDQLAPEAPLDLRSIAERAMSRAKDDRFPTAKELAAELARFEAGQLLASREYTTRELVARWLRRHKRAAAVALAGVIAVIVLAITWSRYQRAAGELAIRERGMKLTDLFGDVARQASQIDLQLLALENALEGLTAASAWALSGPEPADAPLYFVDDFADVGKRPTDFTDQTRYRWPVSVEHPVVAIAPGVDRQTVLPKLRRLSPLRHHIRDMVARAAVRDTTALSAADITALLLARKSPIDYAYVDLAEGVHVVWPGIAALPPGYDVRTASFYDMSKGKRGRRWGTPYVDSTTAREDDLVLPCTQGVWSPAGEFLGVAGVEITVTKLVETRLAMPTRATLRTSLVDKRGRTVIDSTLANQRFAASGKDEALELPTFDLPDIVAAIGKREDGIREITRDGRPIVVAFVRLDTIGWYYVVEVDASLGLR
jgi:hypothetical protein